jgi:uncharacterized repeat protein (TIGR03806 family)
LAAIGCLLAMGWIAQGAEAVSAPAVESLCHWADGPIQIDGAADEAAWNRAPWIDRFALPWLKGADARPARTATKARLLWDRQFLYFHAEMQDGDLYADVLEHDGRTWDNDVIELFLKPSAEEPGYYEFQVNAAGTVMDMFLPRRGAGGYARFKSDGAFQIETQVKLRGTLNDWTDKDQSWSVEGRIPWLDLMRTGGRPEPDARWKFALCRYDYSVDFEGPELSTNAPLNEQEEPDFHGHEQYATLRFVGPQAPAEQHAARQNSGEAQTSAQQDSTPQTSASQDATPRGFERFMPCTTSRVVGSPEEPLPYRVRRAYPQMPIELPIAVIAQPGTDRMIVINQDRPHGATRLMRFVDTPDVEASETLVERDDTAYGIAFHPDFAHNGYLYVGSSGPGNAEGEARRSRVTRYAISGEKPGAIDPRSAREIISWQSAGHDGADVTFGLDGMLYVTSGDGTSDSDTNLAGQGLDHLLGKVLRIDVDHPDTGREYGIPTDNPFVDRPDTRAETWAYGLRNPWRITTDPETGHIWVGNNGQDMWEQAYLIQRGANYGWSVYEGSHPFYLNRTLGPTPVVKPTVEHSHSEARSLTGGVVYYGKQLPELSGAYIYGDYSTGMIWAVKHDGQQILWHKPIADTTLQIAGFGLDTRGELLVVDHRGQGQGALYGLEPNPDQEANADFPRRLSETGLFRDVASHTMQPSLIPYGVNAPLWSDGAHKTRYLALPRADSKIDMTASRAWVFPDKTVLVKSFAIEEFQGVEASRRWIETRLLTRQAGEWVGYSYRWNDAGTDATLVDREGLDQAFTINTPQGPRTLAWRYPGRAECMVCHTRAFGFVLGLNTLQMNRDHDYGGVQENQLELLERLGRLQVDWARPAGAALRQQAETRGLKGAELDAYVRQQTASRQKRASATSALLFEPATAYEKLVDPYDASQDLTARARSYLHANCAICHVAAGGGNAQIDLEFSTPPAKMRLLDETPLHHTFEIPDARLIAPGAPQRSVLLHRMAMRERGQMPQLATTRVDRQAVEMLRAWIAGLQPAGPETEPDAE